MPGFLPHFGGQGEGSGEPRCLSPPSQGTQVSAPQPHGTRVSCPQHLGTPASCPHPSPQEPGHPAPGARLTLSALVRSPWLHWMPKAMRQMAAATHIRHCSPPASCRANLTYSGVPRGGFSSLGPSRTSSSAASPPLSPWGRGHADQGGGARPGEPHALGVGLGGCGAHPRSGRMLGGNRSMEGRGRRYADERGTKFRGTLSRRTRRRGP